MRRYKSVGIAVSPLLLPKQGSDLSKWAVVACDQFTSQPEYWAKAAELVGDAPSTLKLIFPEVYLEEENPDARIQSIQETMNAYLRDGVLEPHDGLIYVERETGGRVRKGLVVCVDLDQYDFNKGSTSLIRATEGTIVDRLPPRMRIREGAPLELPHIMVLIDDPEDRVIGSLTAAKDKLAQVYDIDLMMGSGHLSGWRVDDHEIEEQVVEGLASLADAASFRQKYDLAEDLPVLLFAMGDGNHSLATAKAIWERMKEQAGDPSEVADSSARYALVELVNLHDEALEFEPIHRVVFDVASDVDLEGEMKAHFGEGVTFNEVSTLEELTASVDAATPGVHRIGLMSPAGLQVIEVRGSASNLPVGTLQGFLDGFMERARADKIDYVHGTETVQELGAKPGNLGFYLPAMSKHELFKTVILDGALPRKTFSMGEAEEKRFYLECRRLV